MGLTSTATISFLSSGAPTGSIVLASTPAQVAEQPAAPALITGLAANGIPNVALNAYRVAAARMGTATPSCGIDWSLLAGIGRIESNHGRFRGAVLNSDGTSTPRILGPALDGVQFAFIRDTDRGQWDGDATYDRAVGPMQFIPATWRAYGIDADGTGSADPFNINDAGLGAAHYLCVAGGDLRTDAGRRKAVMAYNHSDSYVNEVLALARAYATGIPVADLPLVGNTTGAVPAPSAYGSSGYYGGPAAPGPAIGARDMTPASGDTTGESAQGGGAPEGSGTRGQNDAADSPPAPAGETGGGSGSQPVSGPATGSGSGTGTGTGTGSGSGSGSGGSAPVAPSAPVTVPAPPPVPQPTPLPAPPVVPLPVPEPPPLPVPTCGGLLPPC
jgi:hypothetical protein